MYAEAPAFDDGQASASEAVDYFPTALTPVRRRESSTSPRLSRPRATLDLPFQVDILAGQLAPSSLAMYARDVRAYLRFAGSADTALAPETLARFRAELAEAGHHSPNTINRMLSAVKRLVHEAAAQAYVEHETAAAFGRVSGVRVRALRGSDSSGTISVASGSIDNVTPSQRPCELSQAHARWVSRLAA